MPSISWASSLLWPPSTRKPSWSCCSGRTPLWFERWPRATAPRTAGELEDGAGLELGGGGRPGALCQSWGTWRISQWHLSFPFAGEKTSPEGEVCHLTSPKRETGIKPRHPTHPHLLLLHQRSGGAVRVGPTETLYAPYTKKCWEAVSAHRSVCPLSLSSSAPLLFSSLSS